MQFNESALKEFLVVFFVLLSLMFIEIGLKKLYFLVFNKHTKVNHFSWGKYFYFITVPFLASFYFFSKFTSGFLVLFFSFLILGTFAEWLVGFVYNKVTGQRLWTYHKYHIGHYTSLLSMPIWGLAGVLFWFFIRIFI